MKKKILNIFRFETLRYVQVKTIIYIIFSKTKTDKYSKTESYDEYRTVIKHITLNIDLRFPFLEAVEHQFCKL